MNAKWCTGSKLHTYSSAASPAKNYLFNPNLLLQVPCASEREHESANEKVLRNTAGFKGGRVLEDEWRISYLLL